MKKNIFIILLLIFETITAFSQTGVVITSKVIDAESKEPLVFAHVSVKNLSTGTFTDENGYFTLAIPKSSINDTLTISFIGYETLNLIISKIKHEDILLTPKVNMIEEIAIVASYNPKKIFKKVRKNLKKNYPLNTPFCAKTFFREYYKKDSSTVHMFEASITMKTKGIKYNDIYNNAEFDIDTINYFYRADYNEYYFEFMLGAKYQSTVYIPKGKGKYNIDSVFYKNNEKYISITFIPKMSDSILSYKYAILVLPDGTEYELPVLEQKVKRDESNQYSLSEHYIINLKDYAVTEWSDLYVSLGKPYGFYKNNSYEKKINLYHKYEKIGDKYFVKQQSFNTVINFVNRNNVYKNLFTIKVFDEIVYNNIETNCLNTDLTPYIYGHLPEFIEKYKDKIHPSTINVFEDDIKKDYLKDIKKENIIKQHTSTNKPNAH